MAFFIFTDLGPCFVLPYQNDLLQILSAINHHPRYPYRPYLLHVLPQLLAEMLQTHTLIFWLASALFGVFIYQKWTAYTLFRAAALQHKCQRPRKYPHLDPIWGYDLHRKRTTATQCGQVMKLWMSHFSLYGKTFEEQRFFDTKIINTMEAANIQQVAALSFDEWGRSASSNALSSPFLGRGIFTEDGVFWKHSRDLIKPLFARSEISDVSSLGVFVDRLFELIPRDGSTIDIQPLLHKLVFKLFDYHHKSLIFFSFSIFQHTFCSGSRWIRFDPTHRLTPLNSSRLSTNL